MSSNPIHEVVEASGHLIDSHIMENIFDTVVEFSGKFEVEQFRIGRTNSEPSYLRLKVETPTEEQMNLLLAQLLGFGCSPADGGDAELKMVEKDCCAPEDFYSVTLEPDRLESNNNSPRSYFFGSLPPWWKSRDFKQEPHASNYNIATKPF